MHFCSISNRFAGIFNKSRIIRAKMSWLEISSQNPLLILDYCIERKTSLHCHSQNTNYGQLVMLPQLSKNGGTIQNFPQQQQHQPQDGRPRSSSLRNHRDFDHLPTIRGCNWSEKCVRLCRVIFNQVKRIGHFSIIGKRNGGNCIQSAFRIRLKFQFFINCWDRDVCYACLRSYSFKTKFHFSTLSILPMYLYKYA